MPREKYACPCCGYNTLTEKPPGTFDICPVCYWEDDNVQFFKPTYEGGANGISLQQARKNFKEIGAITPDYIENVRPPNDDEKIN